MKIENSIIVIIHMHEKQHKHTTVDTYVPTYVRTYVLAYIHTYDSVFMDRTIPRHTVCIFPSKTSG